MAFQFSFLERTRLYFVPPPNVSRVFFTLMQDTRSHSNLLGDVGAGMLSSASSRRHALRAEALESFGKPLPSKPPVIIVTTPVIISTAPVIIVTALVIIGHTRYIYNNVSHYRQPPRTSCPCNFFLAPLRPPTSAAQILLSQREGWNVTNILYRHFWTSAYRAFSAY